MNVVAVPSIQQRATLMGGMGKSVSVSQLSGWIYKLGVTTVKKVFARVIDGILSAFVGWAYGGVYNSEVQVHLRYWVEHVLAVYIKLFLYTCDVHGAGSGGGGAIRSDRVPKPTEAEIEKWHGMASRRLHALRVDELFDMVVDWPNTISGIDDLRPFLGTPQSRQYVIERFSRSLQTRLLHPGASTVEILQIYVSIIRAFKKMDGRGVLLGRVSARLRQYLRERDDTVKVVVAGLLSDVSTGSDEAPTMDQENPEILSELAWELQNREPAAANKGSSGLDWNNMDWVPDAIDAAPADSTTGRGNKSDVIGSVISLFDSKDVFVKELQSALAERLLRNKEDYDQETSVIEHLKIRFGDTVLQACEVMLRDVLDSRRLDGIIRRDQGLNDLVDDSSEDQQEPEVHAKILSRLFWPTLPGLTGTTIGGMTFGLDDDDEQEHFTPPMAVAHQRHLYEKGFESLKQTRKLSWNDNLGQVEIEITFADGRTYTDEVLPYQAGVIYAFQADDDDDSAEQTQKQKASKTKPQPKRLVSKTVTSLSNTLHLPPMLVRSACLLFVSKKVLTTNPSTPDTFTVLEYLPSTTRIDPTTTSTTHDLNPSLSFTSTSGTLTHGANTTSTAISTNSANSSMNPSHLHHQGDPTDTLTTASATASARAAELAAAAAQRDTEARERAKVLEVYKSYITAMLVNGGAMPLARITMMLGIVVPGGIGGVSQEEIRGVLEALVSEGVVEGTGSGGYKKKG